MAGARGLCAELGKRLSIEGNIGKGWAEVQRFLPWFLSLGKCIMHPSTCGAGKRWWRVVGLKRPAGRDVFSGDCIIIPINSFVEGAQIWAWASPGQRIIVVIRK